MRSNIIGFVTVEVYALLELCSNAPRQASRAGEMLSKRSQTANVSTLLEAKRRSSFVIWKWSNNRMQRSRASRFLNVASMQHARPADTER